MWGGHLCGGGKAGKAPPCNGGGTKKQGRPTAVSSGKQKGGRKVHLAACGRIRFWGTQESPNPVSVDHPRDTTTEGEHYGGARKDEKSHL